MIECLFVYLCGCVRDKCENLMDCVCIPWCCPPGRTVIARHVNRPFSFLGLQKVVQVT